MYTMVDTSVGVRELRQAAPELVKRAERGEQIVITRHGKPAAMLGPAPQQHEKASSEKARLWLKERAAFEKMLPMLERRYRGRYVAVCGGKVVLDDSDHERLFERVWKRLHGRVVYIGRVGGEAPVIDMPGFELDR